MVSARHRIGPWLQCHCDRVTKAAPPPRRRDLAWAFLLAALLTAGALGVLLFNTALQRQATQLTNQQQVANRLQLQTQELTVSLNQLSDPASLALQARRLHMHPAGRVRWIRPHHRR
jgi:predicted PurR-regulated permease PerM